MLGAIIGDIVGSVYEFNNIKTKDFQFFSTYPKCFFTDDTVMTFATYRALEKCNGKYKKLSDYTIKFKQEYGKLYPNMSYGNAFKTWINTKIPQPYNSYGNGAAMSVSPVAYYSKNIEELKDLVYKVTSVSHNHPEGIKGAEATAVAVWLALKGENKEEIKNYIENNYYKLNYNYDDLKENYRFNETCQETVPQAIYCFLISKDFEDAIRIGISIGGDSDTLCAITGSIAEAYYGVPQDIKAQAIQFLDEKLLKEYLNFQKNFNKLN